MRLSFVNISYMIDSVPSVSELTLHDWGKSIFWIVSVASLVFSSVAISFGIIYPSLLPVKTSIFSSALPVLVNMIGFLFIIFIFIIQNITREYTPELSKEVYKDKYLILIFSTLLFITLYNVTGVYFGLDRVFQSIGFVLTISSFLYLFPLSLITGYYLNISNTVKRSEKRVESKISRDSIYTSPPLKNDEFLDELTQDSLLITNTGIKAIENNNHVLAITCIESLENIGETYLEMLVSPAEDEFVRELNDQYQFIIQRTGGDYTSQKYLDPLCRSIGNLSRSTLKNTENIAQISLWLKSLREIFDITYPEMDRTTALGTSIEEINRTTILALENRSDVVPNHYTHCSSHLEEIARWSLRNEAGIPLRMCLSQFQWHYITMMNAIISGRYYREHQIMKPLEEIITLYSSAWNNGQFDKGMLEASFFRRDSLVTLFRCYGLYSLTSNQAALHSQVTTRPPEELKLEPREEVEFGNARQELHFIEGCGYLVDFVKKITKDCPGTNYYDAYSAYPELLFVFCNDLETEFSKGEESELIEELVSSFFECMLQEVSHSDGKPRSEVLYHLGDFLLILMYEYRSNDNRLRELLEVVIDFYEKTKDRVGESDSRWMYKYLKLCGCIANQYDNLDNTQQLIEEKLVPDFYDISRSGRALIPKHRELGYPSGRVDDIKTLSTNQIWTGYQRSIEAEFYEEILDECEAYHEYLKERSDSRSTE